MGAKKKGYFFSFPSQTQFFTQPRTFARTNACRSQTFPPSFCAIIKSNDSTELHRTSGNEMTETKMHYDAIVIGAGPAGAVAAHDLAKGGFKVALLEKQTLPRHKTCGGGIPTLTKQLLSLAEVGEVRDLAPNAFVECQVTQMRHTYGFDDPHLGDMNPDKTDDPNGELSLWMVQRSVFDNALAQRAARAGADLLDGLSLRSLEIEKGKPVLVRAEGKTGAWTATADVVIGADGANGLTAKCVGLRKERALAIAIEAEVPHTWGTGHPDLRPDVAHLEFGAVKLGYAWVFPKGDHINVGAGVFRPKREDGRGDTNVRELLHQAIHDYLAMLGVPKEPGSLIYHAHPLPIWDGLDQIQTRDNRVLLVGDAAGLINPFFGDGIFHAMTSGKIAAQCVLAGNAKGYTKAIAHEFKANFDSALRIAKIFYQWPHFAYRHGIKRPYATYTATKLLSGQVKFNEVSGRIIGRIRSAMRVDKKAGLLTQDEMPDSL